MIEPQRLLAFAAMTVVFLVIPGPSVLFVVGRALAYGRGTALATVVGNTLGAYVLVIAVAVGIGGVVERSVLAFTVIKLVGAAYLMYLGFQALRAARAVRPAPERAGAAALSTRRAMWEGAVVGATNPKTVVFLTAVLPQFVDREAGHAAVQMLLFGVVGSVLALVCDSAWGLVASAARDWFGRSERRMAAVGRTGGAAMIGLGVTVAVTGRPD